MPKSLYARGLWMILLPIIVLQLVIGALILQRYFYQMTRQLTQHVIERIEYTFSQADDWQEFQLQLSNQNFHQARAVDISHFGNFDITGRLILKNFETHFGKPVYINNSNWGTVQVSFPFDGQRLDLIIPRAELAPINPHQILLNTTGFSFLIALFSLLFLRNQTRSISRLSQAAKAFGRGETVSYIPSGSLEVRSAGRSFLAMRKRITHQREQRNLLLSGVSHDLRTPLTRMRLTAELTDDDALKKQLLYDIAILEDLSNSFLNYATNDIKEGFETIDIMAKLQNISKGFTKIKKITGQPYQHRLRPILFERAITNLLSNAERYAENIELSLEKRYRDLIILIDDDGEGIAESEREEALKAFTRLDPSRGQSSRGHAGLGLAIAADAIRQHGGSLNLLTSPKGGLRVEIRLPQKIEKI